jgi:hypothetical protein
VDALCSVGVLSLGRQSQTVFTENAFKLIAKAVFGLGKTVKVALIQLNHTDGLDFGDANTEFQPPGLGYVTDFNHFHGSASSLFVCVKKSCRKGLAVIGLEV